MLSYLIRLSRHLHNWQWVSAVHTSLAEISNYLLMLLTFRIGLSLFYPHSILFLAFGEFWTIRSDTLRLLDSLGNSARGFVVALYAYHLTKRLVKSYPNLAQVLAIIVTFKFSQMLPNRDFLPTNWLVMTILILAITGLFNGLSKIPYQRVQHSLVVMVTILAVLGVSVLKLEDLEWLYYLDIQRISIGVILVPILANLGMPYSSQPTGNVANAVTESFNQFLGGEVITHPLNLYSVVDSYLLIGGAGLMLALAFEAGRRRHLVPMLFDQNFSLIAANRWYLEPLILFPMILSSSINAVIVACCIAFNWVSVPILTLPENTPNLLQAFLASNGDWRNLILSGTLVGISYRIYQPYLAILKEAQDEKN